MFFKNITNQMKINETISEVLIKQLKDSSLKIDDLSIDLVHLAGQVRDLMENQAELTKTLCELIKEVKGVSALAKNKKRPYKKKIE